MCLNTGYPCYCLSSENVCELCRMTAKDKKDHEDSHGSHMHTGMGSIYSISSVVPSPSQAAREKGQKWGWLLSGIISLNILTLGCALISGSAFEEIDISDVHLQIFLIFLLIVNTIWMLYYIVYTSRGDHAVLYKDGHAGPVWLRGGLVLFGICSLIMDMFKIVNYVGYLHCDSVVKIVFPVVQCIFILVQTYFLWIHAMDCVQLQRNTTRCGLMLTLSTNLVLWMTAVTEESIHQTSVPGSLNQTGERIYSRASYGEDDCQCSHSSCYIFKEAYYYLYPFNIEYSLFASAMSYVMWKNVGRQVDDHSHHKLKFSFKNVNLGPAAGLVLLMAGLATFVVYEVDINKEDQQKRDDALMMHFVTNIVIASLMSLATLVGCGIYMQDQRDHVSEKSPTRSLDVWLLVGASMGQFLISYFTIVAVVATGVPGYLNVLNLSWAILTVIQLCLQNFFIIEGLHRKPFQEVRLATVFSNPPAFQDMGNYGFPKTSPVMIVNNAQDQRIFTWPGLTWKRKALKEISAFLVLANIILWIMPAFGARPQFDHTIGVDFYKFTIWTAVVNIGLPFGIFYRMHSVASLFEVLLTS
ncbi:proton channel OTOP2 [Aplochiton taeniatus]